MVLSSLFFVCKYFRKDYYLFVGWGILLWFTTFFYLFNFLAKIGIWLDTKRVFMAFFLISSGFTLNFTHCVASLLMFALKAAVLYLFKLLVYLCVIFVRLKIVHSLLSFIIIVNSYENSLPFINCELVCESVWFYTGIGDQTKKDACIRFLQWSHFLSLKCFIELFCFRLNREKFLHGFQELFKEKNYKRPLTV